MVLQTLLIDNYDSYTYNLFQLLAQVSGTEPHVVRNDDPFDELDLDRYQNIVISPGPGHPGTPRDFGMCAQVLETAQVPVLGVCLGHQGMALGAGGRVVPAPTPLHGHVSRVRHNDDLLFADIPTQFDAVRYHSLCVADPLPDDLSAIAWAEDGVIMALRHRTLPRWGVQFHPESIETEYGTTLLRNFLSLERPVASNDSTSPVASPVKSTERPVQVIRYSAVTVELGWEVDAEAAFVGLYGSARTGFWLDSSRSSEGARFSYMGDGSGPLSETVKYTVGEQIGASEATGKTNTESIFDYLQRELGRRVVDAPPLPFDFTGGYIGYFGYELKADCGSPNRHRSPVPDALWTFADRFVVIDHHERRTYLLALTTGESTDNSVSQWLSATAAALRTLPQAPPLSDPFPTPAEGPNRAAYLRDVEYCQEQLRAGESYEICLTTSTQLPVIEPGVDTYRRLRVRNPAPYAAYLRFDEVEVACSSPERFLKISQDRTVEAKPIKGTAPRGDNPERDEMLRRALARDRKTRAENLMITDLIRNDLGRVCEIGSVHVPSLMAVESYETMHQLVSTIRGTLRSDRDVIDCVRSCFPGGSMTGAPKLRTMEIIDAVEDRARGVYSGALGFLGCNGAADLNIVIRTMVRIGHNWHIGAGGAVVLDSNPAAEYEEMQLKASAVTQALPDTFKLTPVPSVK